MSDQYLEDEVVQGAFRARAKRKFAEARRAKIQAAIDFDEALVGLRDVGFSYGQIAEMVGIKSRGHAHAMVEQAVTRVERRRAS